jgi:hypothetical protein
LGALKLLRLKNPAMPGQINSPSPTATRRRDFLTAALWLVVVLVVLFHKSFAADQILFSNDGPLGAVRAHAGHMWSNMLGVWQGLNWVGSPAPSAPLNVTGLLQAICSDTSPDSGPVLFAKIYAPFSLFVLGLSAWFFFRQLRFQPWVCLLGGLAAALNTVAFSNACWGLAEWPLSWAMNLFALAALITPSVGQWWLKAALAGICVGIGVMEGFDVGALFSLFIAGFVFLSGMTGEGPPAKKATHSLLIVAVMAISAALIAAQTVSGLIGTQVKGVVGMAQDEATKQQRWDEATMWSLPKAETLRIIIPGLFGYRMPLWYGESEESAHGSDYWGTVGQTPGNIQSRLSGSGVYGGVLVVLVAVWCAAQSFRKRDSIFPPLERKQIWCWLGLLAVALLLAWGRHTPFYPMVYALPYFSTIRNPIKFAFPFSLALVILFGYGLEGLGRLYLNKPPAKARAWLDQIKAWWKTASTFDRKWMTGAMAAVAASLLGWLIYASSRSELVRHLSLAGFPDKHLANSIAQFSVNEVGLFILFLILCLGLLTLIMSGFFTGARTKWAVAALGLVLVVDLGRANAPWIVYWNYKEKYASNPVIDQLREKPWEHRVTAKLAPMSPQFLVNYQEQNEANLFIRVYFAEWLQHHFQYYRAQSLDIIQMPRMPEFDEAFIRALGPTNNNQAYLCCRMWQLTNTRYLLGARDWLNQLNEFFDPAQRRFGIRTGFNLRPKPGLQEVTKPEQFTAVPAPDGKFALFEFAGALPRAKLFTRWRVNTNDAATLEELRNPDFDPAQSVFVAGEVPPGIPGLSTNQTGGSLEFNRYESKFIQLNADAAAPSVLLLNDRFSPDWNVRVDGKLEPLLRCNYLMRGVYLTPGKHVVEFRFQPPLTTFYISLASLFAGTLLCGYLAATKNSRRLAEARARADDRPSEVTNRKSR